MASPPNRSDSASGSPGGRSSAAILLSRQFKQMQTDKDIPGISCGLVGNSVFDWEIMLMLDEEQDSLYGVYENGEVCISILHPPEDDKYGYESASERWSPVQNPESILLSVISMLGSPNDESPANTEAGKLWRNDKKEFRKRVRKCVRDSQDSAWD
ncbi:Ubiquitin-conjugating enzyme E2 15 [Vermiconidia calcicola]|uniref:Ubiquitin-conjugating enzyme E2 15 n=1 Tax=Vermiconidia calcicola TaxID=1690605 RepID=A0ACC3MCE2_9PEZI|nr:Ubiquitin-conjugating enzyme E2 15 [Vermiconidia calcicola]